MFTQIHSDGVVDLRHLRPIHMLPAGEGMKMIQEKSAKMRERLEEWKKSFPDNWQTKQMEILGALTWGDSDLPEGRIRVGRFGKTGELFVLHGHGRLASLCLLAAQGDIPVEWLRQLPVSLHEIKEKMCIDQITVGIRITLRKFLSPVVIEGVEAKRALLQLEESFPKKEAPRFDPWTLPEKINLNLEIERNLETLQLHGYFSREKINRHLIRMIMKSPVDANRDHFLFLYRIQRDGFLHRLVDEETQGNPVQMAPFLDDMYVADPERIAPIIMNLLRGKISTELFLSMDLEYSLTNMEVLSAVKNFLSERGEDPQIQYWFFKNMLNQPLFRDLFIMLWKLMEEIEDPAILDTGVGGLLKMIALRTATLMDKKKNSQSDDQG